MRYKKQITFLLGICTAIVFCLNIFMLFFWSMPIKRPDFTENEHNSIQGESPVPGGVDIEVKVSDVPSEPAAEGEIAGISTEVYVREVPLPLDEQMDEHLKIFRSKAAILHQKFPESYIISIPTNEKVIALTFDDGPDNSATPEIIEILSRYSVPATFFFIGRQLDENKTAASVAASGHVIGNHSWTHIRPTDIDSETLMDEVNRTQDAIKGLYASSVNNDFSGSYSTNDTVNTNKETRLFRPPYGLVNEDQMPALIEAGYKTVAWSVDSMDWYFTNPDDIAACVINAAHPGAIVLMHSAGGASNRKATIDALPIIIETLQSQGYTFVALDL